MISLDYIHCSSIFMLVLFGFQPLFMKKHVKDHKKMKNLAK